MSLTAASLGVIPGRPKGEPGISRRNLRIPGSPSKSAVADLDHSRTRHRRRFL